MSTHPVPCSKPASAVNSASQPVEMRSSASINPPPSKKISSNTRASQPSRATYQKPSISVGKSQQILRARYKQQWLPPRTWRQEEARKQQEEQLPVIDHRVAAKAAEAHAKAIVAAQDKYFEKLHSQTHAKVQGAPPNDAHKPPVALKDSHHNTRAAAQQEAHPQIPAQKSTASSHDNSGQKPSHTQKQANSPSNRPFRPSFSHKLSSGRVPFPSIESSDNNQATQATQASQAASRSLSPNSRQAAVRPSMRRNSSALSLVAAVQATRSPSIRSDSTSSSRRSSIVSSAESAAQSASNNAAPSSVNSNTPNGRHAASLVGAGVASDLNNSTDTSGKRSRNASLTSDSRLAAQARSRSQSTSSQQSQASVQSQASRSQNQTATGRPQSMFGGVPAPKNQTASAAARASSSHPLNIAPRAPLSSKFVKSLSQALRREQDQSDEQRAQKEALDREHQARKESQAPALSNLALANVTRKLGHIPGTPVVITPRRSESGSGSGSGSQSGASSAYQVAAASPGTKAELTEEQKLQQRRDDQKRANAQQAATLAGSRFEEFMANINTQVNQAMLADQPRRRELMKKYRPAASWSAPVRVIRPQLKRLTTSDTTNSAVCGAPDSAKSGHADHAPTQTPIQTPTQTPVEYIANNHTAASSTNAHSVTPSATASTGGSSVSMGPYSGVPVVSAGTPTSSSSAGGTTANSGNNSTGYDYDGLTSVGISPTTSSAPWRHLGAHAPPRMATTLRTRPRRPRQPVKPEPDSDIASIHSVSSSPVGSISEPKPKQSALGYGAGNLYGGLAAPAGTYDSTPASKNSSQYSLSPYASTSHSQPAAQQPHMLSTLRTKFDNPSRRRFDEDRPWRGHRELMSVSERERKRYESLWAANRDRHLPHLYVPPQFQEAWFDALEQVLPSLKPAISAERDSFSDTASIRTNLKPPSVRSARSIASLRSTMSYHSPPFHTPNQTPIQTPIHTPAQYPGLIPPLPPPPPSSQIYVPFGPSQPPPSLLIQSQQHQQQNSKDRLMMFGNNHSTSSIGSVATTAPHTFIGSSSDTGFTSPSRSSLRHALSQNSFESAVGDFAAGSNPVLSPSFLSPNYTSAEVDPTVIASHGGPKDELPTEEDEGDYVEVPSEEIDMVKEVEKRTNDVHGYIVSRIWRRSRLPEDTLSHIWDLVDNNHDGTLDSSGFVVGMWLCDQCLYGRKLPPKVPSEVWQSVAPLNLKIRVKERRSKIGHVKRLPNYFGNAVGFTMHSGRQAVKRAVQTATK